MGSYAAHLKNKTLFDIVIPGTHDSLTSDLSLRVSDNANDLPIILSKILHSSLPRGQVARFIREQAKTQTLNMTQQLESGIRFIDLRITWTQGPNNGDWDFFVLHILESTDPAIVYLKELYRFLKSNVVEVVVLRVTYHSGDCSGFVGASKTNLQDFWKDVENLFGPLLFNHSANELNTTTFGAMWESNQRLVVFTADWANFTNASSLARDACDGIEQYDPPTGVMNEFETQSAQIAQMRKARQKRSELRLTNTYWISFWSTSTPTSQMVVRAVTDILDPNMTATDRQVLLKVCAQSFEGIPNSTFCPDTLLDVTSLSNYYLSRILNWSLSQPQLFLPHVVYVDNVLSGGLFATDVSKSYAFVAFILRKSLFSNLSKTQCALLSDCAALDAELALYGISGRQANPSRGRIPNWPPLPF